MDQRHLALGGIAAIAFFFEGTEVWYYLVGNGTIVQGSAEVVSSNHSAICNSLAATENAKF